MPELLIAPPVAPSSSPVVSPAASSKQGSTTENKTQATTATTAGNASEQTKSSSGTASAAPADDGKPASFAAVLKQQMKQTREAAATATTAAVDPQALAAEVQPDLQGSEARALLPFIEQLLPQLAKKFQNTEDTTDTTTPSVDAGLSAADAALAMIAAPATPAVTASSPAASSTAALDGGTTNPDAAAAALNLDPEAAKKAPSGADLAATTAISAESADVELAAGSKPESDFSALVSRATEQLASTGPTQSSTHARANGTSDTALHMDTPVGHADWSKELGNKLSWMATAQRQQADLVLNPPQLGRVEISLTVSGDQATAVFSSPSAAVRELLEDSMPRLREILSGSGINLGEAQVGAESQNRFGNPEQGNDNGRSGRQTTAQTMDLNGILPATASEQTISSGRGMVDLFA